MKILDRISQKGFNSEPLVQLDGAKYQAGKEKAFITILEQDTDEYVVGINEVHLADVAWVVICTQKDDCMFKIPVAEIACRHFSKDRLTGRRIANLRFDHEQLRWELITKIQQGKNHRMDLTPYLIDLREDEEIMAMAVLLRDALGIRKGDIHAKAPGNFF